MTTISSGKLSHIVVGAGQMGSRSGSGQGDFGKGCFPNLTFSTAYQTN